MTSEGGKYIYITKSLRGQVFEDHYQEYVDSGTKGF